MTAKPKRAVAANPACDAAIALYEGIARDYIAAVADTGVVFEPRDDAREETARLVEELRARGARVRNAGASIVTGAISPACVFCTGDCVSQTLTAATSPLCTQASRCASRRGRLRSTASAATSPAISSRTAT